VSRGPRERNAIRDTKPNRCRPNGRFHEFRTKGAYVEPTTLRALRTTKTAAIRDSEDSPNAGSDLY